MFRKFADRVSNAVNNVANGGGLGGGGGGTSSSGGNNSLSEGQALQQLMSMGFSKEDSRHALQLCGNNVQQATDWLLNNRNGTTPATAISVSPGMQATAQQIEDDDLQKALAASLADNNDNKTNNNNNNNNPRSAASKRAGQAALARFEQTNNKYNNKNKNTGKKKTTTSKPAYTNYNNNDTTTTTNGGGGGGGGGVKPVTISASHPNVKTPKQMSHHEKEEQIMRCANRMAPYPKAVDMAIKSLKQLQQNPNDPKFKTLDTSSGAFSKHLNVPGAIDFFKAMNYHSLPTNLKILHLSFVDPATIYLGISALEQIQLTEIYLTNKAKLDFDIEIEKLLSSPASSDELSKRGEYNKKCPSEPTTGGSLIQVQIGSTKISRKFDGDDILQDVLNWIAGNTHTQIYDNLLIDHNKKWYLVNMNQNGAYNLKMGPQKTLQALGCWPSGRLQILGTLPEHTTKNTSSRGLGAAGIASDYL